MGQLVQEGKTTRGIKEKRGRCGGKFMLRIFERYSNETTCKMVATSREKDRERGRRLKGEEVEHRGTIREARRSPVALNRK